MKGEIKMNAYLIAIEKNHGDYFPIYWQQTPLFMLQNMENKGRNPNLEEIDRYTSFFDEEGFKEELLKHQAIDEADKNENVVIIFSDTKNRKLEDGIIYAEEKECIEPEMIENYILSIMENPEKLNRLYTKFKDRSDNSSKFNELLFMINNIDRFQPRQLAIGLTCIKELPYLERRSVGLFISRKLKQIENAEIESTNNLALTKEE